MVDIRVRRLADLIAGYCIEVTKGMEVIVSATTAAIPLVVELYRAILQRGGYPHAMITDEVLGETFYRFADEETLKYVPRLDKFIFENIDALVRILSSTHTKYLSSIDPARISTAQAARRELKEIFLRRAAEGKLKWVIAPYPTKALAQEASMSYTEYEDFVFRATMVDREDPITAWKEQAKFQERVAQFLSKISELHIVAEDTDLKLRVEGRKWINDDGKHNMPGGEVFTGPIEDSIEGYIVFTYPAIWGGREVEGIKLVFKKGNVVEAKAIKGEDFLKKMLETDEGAKKVGEFAFGLNYSINVFTKEILFDEKIGGTIHLAVGSSYPETGGRNISAIHWDMIKDMKKGKIYADGDLVYEKGKFIEGIL